MADPAGTSLRFPVWSACLELGAKLWPTESLWQQEASVETHASSPRLGTLGTAEVTASLSKSNSSKPINKFINEKKPQRAIKIEVPQRAIFQSSSESTSSLASPLVS
ncbi:hypothetical protein Y1Q_0006027 [Alligator mississippiensis]|uniref:Uncharacterized protein n=1 Tax=Alligator mississippiensis TaxID=8496 RepID=A0A151N3S8_ALLMI|nr:hypothetical protein Y1Q_0006027 [Alligator mississippiensis]